MQFLSLFSKKDPLKLFKGGVLIYSNERKGPIKLLEFINFVRLYMQETQDLVFFGRFFSKIHAILAVKLGFQKILCEYLTEPAKEFLEMHNIMIIDYKHVVSKLKLKDPAEKVVLSIMDPEEAYKALIFYYNSL